MYIHYLLLQIISRNIGQGRHPSLFPNEVLLSFLLIGKKCRFLQKFNNPTYFFWGAHLRSSNHFSKKIIHWYIPNTILHYPLSIVHFSIIHFSIIHCPLSNTPLLYHFRSLHLHLHPYLSKDLNPSRRNSK